MQWGRNLFCKSFANLLASDLRMSLMTSPMSLRMPRRIQHHLPHPSTWWWGTIVFALLCVAGRAGDDGKSISGDEAREALRKWPEAHGHDYVPHDYPPPFGFSLTEAWLDPWPHSHFSRLGTPLVHFFVLEPAYLGCDLFLDSAGINRDDESEIEVEAEIEWAFTRRIGLVAEIPYTFVDPEDGNAFDGVGDFAVAPRFVLVDTEKFLLSLNTEVAFPTGSESKGLGAGEVIFGPSLSGWIDFGGWVTGSFQVGTEHGLESGDAEVIYRAGLAWSFVGPAVFPERGHAEEHNHYPPGLISLTAELDGRTPLSGEESGISTAEVILGLTYSLTDNLDIRGAYIVPVFEPEELRNGWIGGLIYHF